MAIKCVVLCCFLLININLASYVRPRIIRESEDSDDIILNAGQYYNLSCQGSEPLIWDYPNVTENGKDKWTSFNIVSSEVPHNSDYTYRSVLHITNSSYPFVGFYTCQYENGSDEDKDQVYLYVNDTDHLSVEDKYKVHYAAQHQETTIPCRPTTPDIQVELISYGTDQIEHTFDPKTGFTFTVNDLSYQDTYSCLFNRSGDDRVIEYLIFLTIIPSRSFLATPFIEDLSNNHTDAGQTLNLKCSLQESSRNIQFDWQTPIGKFSDASKSNKVKVDRSLRSEIKGKDFLISNLHVYNTALEDAGTYSCIVSDRQNHVSNSEVYVMVHDGRKE